jgi:hypothetical protein
VDEGLTISLCSRSILDNFKFAECSTQGFKRVGVEHSKSDALVLSSFNWFEEKAPIHERCVPSSFDKVIRLLLSGHSSWLGCTYFKSLLSPTM